MSTLQCNQSNSNKIKYKIKDTILVKKKKTLLSAIAISWSLDFTPKTIALSGTIDFFFEIKRPSWSTQKPPIWLSSRFSLFFLRLSTVQDVRSTFSLSFFFSQQAYVDIGNVNGTAFQRNVKKSEGSPVEQRLTSRSVEYNLCKGVLENATV